MENSWQIATNLVSKQFSMQMVFLHRTYMSYLDQMSDQYESIQKFLFESYQSQLRYIKYQQQLQFKKRSLHDTANSTTANTTNSFNNINHNDDMSTNYAESVYATQWPIAMHVNDISATTDNYNVNDYTSNMNENARLNHWTNRNVSWTNSRPLDKSNCNSACPKRFMQLGVDARKHTNTGTDVDAFDTGIAIRNKPKRKHNKRKFQMCQTITNNGNTNDMTTRCVKRRKKIKTRINNDGNNSKNKKTTIVKKENNYNDNICNYKEKTPHQHRYQHSCKIHSKQNQNSLKQYKFDTTFNTDNKIKDTTLSPRKDFQMEFASPSLPIAMRRRKRECLSRLPIGAYDMFKYDCNYKHNQSQKFIKYQHLKLQFIHFNPNVYQICNFLTKSEINHLLKIINKNIVNDKFEQSFTDTMLMCEQFGHEHMHRSVYSQERTSTFIFLSKHYDCVIRTIEQRAANILGVSIENIENLQIVKYTNGQQFTLHHDAGTLIETDDNTINTTTTNFDQVIQHATNYRVELVKPKRICSYFVYLNTLDENMGGETEFPLIELKVRPVAGMALLWCNVNPQMTDECDSLLIHRACPVIGQNSVKYGINIWVKQNRLDY